VIDDRLERRFVARAKEMAVPRTDFSPGNVGGALEAEHLRLDVPKRVLGDSVAVDPASDMDEVEVRDRGERRASSQDEPRGEQRQVEGLAVVGDEHRGRGRPLGDAIEHRPLLAELTQEELFDDQRAQRCRLEPGEADQKRHRARATGETGRLGVEVDRAGWVGGDQGWVEREQREHPRRRLSAHMHRRASHPVRGRETLAPNVQNARLRFLARER
jgi:hypothetical protein